MDTNSQNVNQVEISKFNRHVTDWWDKDGSMKSLHDINPLRMGYIRQQVPLRGKQVLDIGCGGGILTESLAREGAVVKGIDASRHVIEAALAHEKISRSGAAYAVSTAEDEAIAMGPVYDAVFCLELLEHVPSPLSVVSSCRKLLKPGGDLIFATINRNIAAYMLAIFMAENVLKLLTPGTHSYKKLIKPAELINMCRSQGLMPSDITGFSYNPISRKYYLCKNSLVNYMLHLKKEQHPIDRISEKLKKTDSIAGKPV